MQLVSIVAEPFLVSATATQGALRVPLPRQEKMKNSPINKCWVAIDFPSIHESRFQVADERFQPVALASSGFLASYNTLAGHQHYTVTVYQSFPGCAELLYKRVENMTK